MSLARWQDLCLDATDPERLGAFWAPVLGLRRDPEIPRAVTLVGAEPTQRVWVNLVDRPKRVKNRLHLDVYAESIDGLVSLGATVLAPAEETGFAWTVMADPEGGEFCAFLRDRAELPAYRLHGIGIDCVDARAQARWGEVFGVPVVTRRTGSPSSRDARPRADAGLRALPERTSAPTVTGVTGDVDGAGAGADPALGHAGLDRARGLRRADECRAFPPRTITRRRLADGLEHGHRDRPAGSSLGTSRVGRLGRTTSVDSASRSAADQLAGHDRQPPGSHLHLGRRRAQVAEPVGSRASPTRCPATTRRRCRGSARRWRAAPGPRSGVAIIRTCTSLLPLDSRPSRLRCIDTPITVPSRVRLRLRVLIGRLPPARARCHLESPAADRCGVKAAARARLGDLLGWPHALDLTADAVTLTGQLVDIESVSRNEQAIADPVEAGADGARHLEVVRHGNTVVARTDLGRPSGW